MTDAANDYICGLDGCPKVSPKGQRCRDHQGKDGPQCDWPLCAEKATEAAWDSPTRCREHAGKEAPSTRDLAIAAMSEINTLARLLGMPTPGMQAAGMRPAQRNSLLGDFMVLAAEVSKARDMILDFHAWKEGAEKVIVGLGGAHGPAYIATIEASVDLARQQRGVAVEDKSLIIANPNAKAEA